VQAVEVGWANHAVASDQLTVFSRDLATELAQQLRGLLEFRKAAMNDARDIQGFTTVARSATSWNTMAHLVSEAQSSIETVRKSGIASVREP